MATLVPSLNQQACVLWHLLLQTQIVLLLCTCGVFCTLKGMIRPPVWMSHEKILDRTRARALPAFVAV